MSRKQLLKSIIKQTVGEKAEPLAELLHEDVGRVERLIAALSLYRNDIVGDGMKNLRWSEKGWPSLEAMGTGRPVSTSVSWTFRDQFRPRRFKLVCDLATGEYAATAVAKVDGDWVPFPVSASDVGKLVDLVDEEDIARAAALVREYAERKETLDRMEEPRALRY